MENRKVYFKNITDNLQNPKNPDKKDHYIFLLGTSLNYLHRPPKLNEIDRPRGENFSYLAQVVSQLNEEAFECDENYKNYSTKNKKYTAEEDLQQRIDYRCAQALNPNSSYYAHPYHTATVDLFNGPDNQGIEVSQRLAKSLVVALAAIADGKTKLNISGFSRGAVEAVVLVHELARVKKLLEEDKANQFSLGEIIANSESRKDWKASTAKELDKLVDKTRFENNIKKDKDLKDNLLKNLNALEVKLFILDPVPGFEVNINEVVVRDSIRSKPLAALNKPVANTINWVEPSFFEPMPSFVKKSKVFLMKHERSVMFKAIKPQGVPNENLPGCHGIGNGAQSDQGGYPISLDYVIDENIAEEIRNNKLNPNEKEVKIKRGVTHVQNLVMRDFLQFMSLENPEYTNENKQIKLDHPQLDKLTNKFFREDKPTRRQRMLRNYKKIQANMPAYESLSKTSYPFGGYDGPRRIYYHGPQETLMTDIDSNSETFMNPQHAWLWMQTKILDKFDFYKKPLAERIEWLNNNLNPIFTQSQPVINSLQTENPFIKMVKEEPVLAQESLSLMINNVIQTYLQNNLNFDDRERCKQYVATTLATLLKAEYHADFAKSLSNKIHSDLTNTLIIHQDALLSSTDETLKPMRFLISCSKMKINNTEFENRKIAFLNAVEKLYQNFASLHDQIENLLPWCIETELKNSWFKNLGLSYNLEISIHTLLKGMQDRIIDEQAKLVNAVAELNNTMKIEIPPSDTNIYFCNAVSARIEFEKNPAKIELLNENLNMMDLRIKELQDSEENLKAQLKEANDTITERARLENERHESERVERERIERERIESERIERERLENIRLNNERLENQRVTAEAQKKQLVINKFDGFVNFYISENNRLNKGFLGLFSSHGKRGIEWANQFKDKFNENLNLLNSINSMPKYLTWVISNSNEILKGKLNHRSFKTILLAYNNYIEDVASGKQNEIDIDVSDYVNTYLRTLDANTSMEDHYKFNLSKKVHVIKDTGVFVDQIAPLKNINNVI